MKNIIYLFLLLSIANVAAQSPKPLPEWEDICYCSTNNAFHPNRVVKSDNNWYILFNMRDGSSLQRLDSLNITYTQSQLMLLESQKLIKNKNGIYKTVVPILDSLQTLNLRTDSQTASKLLYPNIEKECNNLVKYLNGREMQDNSFSILFSYVLDGMIWDKMEENGLIDNRTGNNIWSGFYWFLENKRQFSCGTNSFSIGGNYKVNFNWSEPLLRSDLSKGLFSSKQLKTFLKYIDNGGQTLDNTELDKWINWGVLSPEGQIRIPIIDKNNTNEIYSFANNISNKLLFSFTENIDIDSIREKYNFSDNKQAIVIFYHEVMWDLLNELIENDIIKIPSALKSANDMNVSEIRNLLFLEKI